MCVMYHCCQLAYNACGMFHLPFDSLGAVWKHKGIDISFSTPSVCYSYFYICSISHSTGVSVNCRLLNINLEHHLLVAQYTQTA